MTARFDRLFTRGNQSAQMLLATGLLVLSIIRFAKTDRARRSRLDTWLIAVVSDVVLFPVMISQLARWFMCLSDLPSITRDRSPTFILMFSPLSPYH